MAFARYALPGEDDAPARIMLARRPVTTIDGRLAGYEVLDLHVEGTPLGRSGSGAQLALAALTSGELHEVTGGLAAYVGVPAGFLHELEGLPFPPDDIVIEVPPATLAEPNVAKRLVDLHDGGHRVILEGWDPSLAPEDILASVTGIKVAARDADALAAGGRVRCAQRIATGVDDHETRALCARLGYTHVQGGVLLAPAPGADAAGSAASIARLRLATGMGEDLDAIELAISQDVGLALRLLRYLNSAAFGLRSRISSIRQAVHMLGPRTVRQWAMLVVVADVGGAASPLVTIALGRARLCEAIAARFGQADTAAYFACGLLSVADALCRRPMRDVVADLPLSDDVVAALLDREGGKGRALRMVELVEAGRADEAAAGPLAADTLRALHTAALRWSDQTVGGLAS